MTNSLARFRVAGSFIAGILIGLSIIVAVFAMMVMNGEWQMLSMLAAFVFALGLTLQVVVIAKPGHRPMADAERGASRMGFMLMHER